MHFIWLYIILLLIIFGMNKAIDNYVLKEIIGEGQYGKVYKAFNTQTYLLYAIKVIKADKFKQVPKLQEFTMNEIKILSKLQHPNIVKFIQMLKTTNNMYLVYQYCENGTLQELINKKKYLSEEESIDIFRQILSAFKVLTEHNILHRDIKPSNILFNNGVIKIADFGFCKSLQPHQMTHTMVGSPIYMAPEILKGAPYTTKADIWSLGVVLYECLYGFCPYQDKSIARLIKLIDNKDLYFPQIPKISKEIIQIIKKMITINPSKRINWESLFNLDLFKENSNRNKMLYIKKLEDIEYYKAVESPRYTSRSEEEGKNVIENFLQFLIKERKKVLYLNLVIKAVNENRLTETFSRITRLLLSRSRDIYSRIFHAIKNLDSDRQYTQTQKNRLKNSKELASFIEIITPEKQMIDECHILYKNSYQTLEEEPTLKLFTEEIVQYVKDIRYQDSSSMTFEVIKHRYIHCNEILDCVLLVELFQNYISIQKDLSDQKYFLQMRKLTKQNLSKIIDHKIKYIEKKYQGL